MQPWGTNRCGVRSLFEENSIRPITRIASRLNLSFEYLLSSMQQGIFRLRYVCCDIDEPSFCVKRGYVNSRHPSNELRAIPVQNENHNTVAQRRYTTCRCLLRAIPVQNENHNTVAQRRYTTCRCLRLRTLRAARLGGEPRCSPTSSDPRQSKYHTHTHATQHHDTAIARQTIRTLGSTW